jgi:hypothetical protein
VPCSKTCSRLLRHARIEELLDSVVPPQLGNVSSVSSCQISWVI